MPVETKYLGSPDGVSITQMDLHGHSSFFYQFPGDRRLQQPRTGQVVVYSPLPRAAAGRAVNVHYVEPAPGAAENYFK